MVELKIKEYDSSLKDKWDEFVLSLSINGTFLQTKNFLDYHNGRFDDCSLLIYKGSNTIVAVVPACTLYDEGRRVFSSHCGSTFGGIVIAEEFYDIEHVEAMIDTLEKYLYDNGYNEVVLKCTSDIFSRRNTNLLYYFLFQKGYTPYDELSCYVDFKNYNEDIISNFSAGRRRGYKHSLRNDLRFAQLSEDSEVEKFYDVLCGNLQKFNAEPVHSLAELLEFKNERLADIVRFYGVFNGEDIVAGSMVFLFGNAVFHTQYLAADQECLQLYPMNFLDANLIETAYKSGFKFCSFGTSTREHGKVLNKKLAEFKEGFGTEFGVNKTYVKHL